MAFLKRIDRVWIIPTEVAGYSSSLQKGFHELGKDCQVLNLSRNIYSYDIEQPSSKLASLLGNLNQVKQRSGRFVRFLLDLVSIPLRFLFVFFNFRKNTLIICLFGKSILKGFDLIFARAMGACVVTVFLGSDSRPPYISGPYLTSRPKLSLSSLKANVKKISRSVSNSEKFSDLVVCSPSTAHFLNKNFVNWFEIGMPSGYDLSSAVSESMSQKRGCFRIAHAPSNPKTKGTVEIQNAISELQDEGYLVEFQLLQGKSNKAVKEAIRDVDLIVDELYSDTFMGGLGSEAAAMGIPFLTFGYAKDSLQKWSEESVFVLAGYDHPKNLKEKIRWAINDTEGRKVLARHQSNFQEINWSRHLVAERFLNLASGDFPSTWLFSPSDVDYIWGAGISKEVLIPELRSYLSCYGVQGLYLKPESPTIKEFNKLISDSTDKTVNK